jgi:hypothetical protein
VDHFGDLLQIGAALARFSGASSLSAFARFPILLRPTSDATPSTIVNRINIPLVRTNFLPMGISVFILLFSLLTHTSLATEPRLTTNVPTNIYAMSKSFY